MDKSPEAFRTISEVAEFLDTPAHVLRFWESRFPQIRPVKRAGGRRYYRPGDVALLAGIKKLLHDEGMTIRGVQKILREHGIRHVAGLASGDSAALMDDADIEAVLSAEYGMRDRLTDDPPSPEALQTAQIISLETALNRQEPARDSLAVQAELWPPALLDSPTDDTSAEAWPGDPGDLPPPAPIAADGVTDTDSSVALPPEVGAILEDQTAEMQSLIAEPPEAVSQSYETTDQSGSLLDADSAQEAATDSPASQDAEPSDGDETVQTYTVASLLRHTNPAELAGKQPQLIVLRDRLIDLRGRVAEAARRKAK